MPRMPATAAVTDQAPAESPPPRRIIAEPEPQAAARRHRQRAHRRPARRPAASAEAAQPIATPAETPRRAGGRRRASMPKPQPRLRRGAGGRQQPRRRRTWPKRRSPKSRSRRWAATTSIEQRETRERRRRNPIRQYKIQEVIKRRQILLVQVVKEERGNKGAALTTYLSLAGRYCVLMPNAGRGGGISRKISNPADRKRMKEVLGELDVPQGMGVILRTAGLERATIDIKRDYEYLSRLWNSIRELTMRSTAPALIYEEGDLIKRSLRDVYDTDIAQVLVEGEAGFNAASRVHAPAGAAPGRARSSSTRSRSPSSTATRWKASSTPCIRRSCSCAPAATSSSIRPRRWSPSTSTRAARPRSATSRRRRCAPTSRRPRRSPARSACATSPA